MSTTATISRSPSIEASAFKATSPKVDAEAAKRLANRFILENLPDRFCAGTPRFLQFPLRTFWAVPVVFSYSRLRPLGQTGILAVDTETGAVVGWTPLDEIKEIGKTIYDEKRRISKPLFCKQETPDS